ncbi:MAG: glutathione S-transferase protein [Proteobacteria bacterium]|nr:glutathione S-transferase protein [Pseudomonadota bacterium]
MLTIYGVYKSRASRLYWLAEELGLAFRKEPVIQARKVAEPLAADAPLNTRTPSFLAVNPMGQVPAIDDDGLVLTESLAILLYLAKKHGGPLAPTDLPEEGLMLQWLFWGAAAAEPLTIVVTQGDESGEWKTEAGKVRLAGIGEALKRPLSAFETRLSAAEYVVGGRFTVVDLGLAEIIRYAQGHPELFQGFPNVKAWLERCQSRPAFKAMWATRTAE